MASTSDLPLSSLTAEERRFLERAREARERFAEEEKTAGNQSQAPEPVPRPSPERPHRRPKPKDDPWEEKGLFGRRKKPDWEK